MSEEGKDFQFLCFDITFFFFFFFLVVVCFMFDLEILGYVLPSCPPTQTHQRRIGFRGASNPCGVSVPSICYFKLFGFLGWVNKFGLSMKKTPSRLVFHLFCERHLSWKKRKCVYPLVGRRLSTFWVLCSKQSLSSSSQCDHCKQRGWTWSESSQNITRKCSVCYFHGKKRARSADFTGGAYACAMFLFWPFILAW